MLSVRLLDTPIGRLQLVAAGDRLCRVAFPGAQRGDLSTAPSPVLAAAAAQLEAYFAGHRRSFDLPLAPEGSDFQRAVWAALATIPWGRTCSYGELARALGRPRAARAVGAASGRNPLPVVVPCHRLIGSGGALTGYAGGLARKRQLLALERPAAGAPQVTEAS